MVGGGGARVTVYSICDTGGTIYSVKHISPRVDLIPACAKPTLETISSYLNETLIKEELSLTSSKFLF
jgi:hypothetical protein